MRGKGPKALSNGDGCTLKRVWGEKSAAMPDERPESPFDRTSGGRDLPRTSESCDKSVAGARARGIFETKKEEERGLPGGAKPPPP